jgi:hypothetical protein
MPKKILTVGIELASDDAVHEAFQSKISLLDWDIVLFRPLIDDFIHTYSENYKGRPSLSDYSSFALKESCEHWRREIKQAVENGKTVVVFLPPVNEVYVDSGKREYSGTGRNQKTTRLVEPYNNYFALPIGLVPVNTAGTEMKLSRDAAILAPYWSEFGGVSKYEVLLSHDTSGICLATKTGDKPVGAVIRHVKSSGSLVLLPNIDFAREEFFIEAEDEEEGNKEGEEDGEDDSFWTPEAEQFANRMIHAIVGLDGALRASVDITPEPDWAADPIYELTRERILRSELLEAERQLEAAQKQKEEVQERLRDAGDLRALLYEKGKPLELAIVKALKLMGFNAEPFQEGGSEFDVVFECPEGRLLGEAEGKDTKAVNVDKLRQLMMNIQEDLQREEVNSPAKAVLFGNGYRLQSPHSREEQFTSKCVASAKAMNTALIATSALYRSVQYLANSIDPAYSKLCRQCLLDHVGLVELPAPPVSAIDAAPIQAGDNDVAQRA